MSFRDEMQVDTMPWVDPDTEEIDFDELADWVDALREEQADAD